MRDVEGLLPQEAFDELLKFLFFRECADDETVRSGNDVHQGTAEEIRGAFSRGLRSRAPWALHLWRDGQIHLSDRSLLDIDRLFAGIRITEIPLDVRSTALRTFLSPDIRRGLGIFLTPEDVVRMMVEVVRPAHGEVVLDPACGSGTFLLGVAQFLGSSEGNKRLLTLYGVEKNPRMLLLADLNLRNRAGLVFERACADSLRDLGHSAAAPLGLLPGSVDVILTNPPFGVTVTRDTGVLRLFDDAAVTSGEQQDRVPSEVLFTELCLRLLRPGGRLAIVLPRSVLTNERLAGRRKAIDELGHLTDLIDLPAETFASTGAQTTTVAAFFRKHPARRSSTVAVRVCHVTNVGFDSTGRPRSASQLIGLAERLAAGDSRVAPTVTRFAEVAAGQTLQRAAALLSGRNGRRHGARLDEYVDFANAGRTPGRPAYTDDGMFILKVGNLTGRGIDWEPRDRNFVSRAEGARRAQTQRLMLERGDVLLTASAHAARYIAKKVDVVSRIPEGYGRITFVGEIIRVRPAKSIDPFILLAALRHRYVRDDLQSCVRGQTAHLNPADLLAVTVPCDLRAPTQELLDVADLLRQEAQLSDALNAVALEARSLLDSASAASV